MARPLPAPLREVVDRLATLPGLGPKSALRIGLTLLRWPEERTRDLGERIVLLRENLHICRRCGALAETPVCALCQDPARSDDELCVVAEWDSILVMEEMGVYRGRYVVLGGLLAPLDGMDTDRLDFARLEAVLQEGRVREVILALGSTMEAEATASLVTARIKARFPAVRVTRLAQGIPLGAELKYVDPETLKQSLKYRQDL
ncbi:MAG: recombination protein RecR [Desulfomicrobiaceae bacterium]|nr:recombination protein RecR [Desulfomicrobiaceae bacterium]MDI3492829.1 recombination protein RecR [Desulfomicrobiaceae bacterium]MDK2873632.1 recombination protein RecR [Desulfomicrobiaceae bacterium]